MPSAIGDSVVDAPIVVGTVDAEISGDGVNMNGVNANCVNDDSV